MQQGNINSDGTYWQPVDSFNLSTTVTPASTGSFIVAGNADLFTANATYNQAANQKRENKVYREYAQMTAKQHSAEEDGGQNETGHCDEAEREAVQRRSANLD